MSEPTKRMQQSEPMDFVNAVMEHRLASEAQHRAEQFLSEKIKEHGECTAAFRKALAAEIVVKKSEGHPATLCKELARGDARVAELESAMLVAEGMVEAAKQSIWRHTADRKDLEQFLDWSKRAAFLDSAQQQEHR